MSKDKRIQNLEDVLAQFLQPIRNIPFNLVVRAMTGHEVIDFDSSNSEDIQLLQSLIRAGHIVAETVAETPIRRPRPNEVGNDLEPYVMSAIRRANLLTERPKAKDGRGQGVGYPDILISQNERKTYLEVKSYADGSALTTMRSFYLSPSENPKISCDARHLLIGFGMTSTPVAGSRDSLYFVSSFQIANLFSLKCDVKYEFNSDNFRLYDKDLILHSAKVS